MNYLIIADAFSRQYIGLVQFNYFAAKIPAFTQTVATPDHDEALAVAEIVRLNPKVWIVIGIGVAGIVILVESRRRRKGIVREDFGVFVQLLPYPQPSPPDPRQALAGLTFSVEDKMVCPRDPSILHRVGHILLKLNAVEPRRLRQILFADDLFELSNVPKHKSVHVITKVGEKLSGYHPPKHMNIGKHIASNVPSLKAFYEDSTNLKNRTSSLKTLSSVMLLLQRCEFKRNYEEWFTSIKPKLGPCTADRVTSALNSSMDDVNTLYRLRSEMRADLQNLLKDNAILVMPTVADGPIPINTRKRPFADFCDRALTLLGISSMSGCCQVSIPIGTHDGYPVSISIITYHGGDKFLLNTVLDMYLSIQEQVGIASTSLPPPDINGDMDTFELLKEKGNAAYKGRQWNKAVTYDTEALT